MYGDFLSSEHAAFALERNVDMEHQRLGRVSAMTERRKWLLIGLVPLFGVLFLGMIGTYELLIWLALVVAWTVLFFKRGKSQVAHASKPSPS